jgi:hypothetical protein
MLAAEFAAKLLKPAGCATWIDLDYEPDRAAMAQTDD